MDLPYEIASAPRHIQEHYLAMIADGQSEKFAVMCALQCPPGSKESQRAFLEGRQNGEWLNRLPPAQAKRMAAAARSMGIDPSARYYFGGIADKRNIMDPKAWVADEHDVKRVAEERGLDVEGGVNYKSSGRNIGRKHRDVALAPDILARETAKEMLNDPGLSKKAARQKAKDRVTPHWKKSK